MKRGARPEPDATGGAAPRRADVILVERGFFESRARAQAAIAAGLVTVDGRAIRRASAMIPDAARITAEAPHPYVSRAGLKLAHALDAFGFDPSGRRCLDVGASTGGFTDVLLRRGAEQVIAVDVGHGQLHPSLAGDPRVLSLEGTDIRRLDASALPGAASLASVDVSFISLRLVVPELKRFLKTGAELIALVKPQFEVGRANLGRGGIVKDARIRHAVLDEMAAFVSAEGWTVLGTEPSPVAGGDGNQEFLIGARLG